MNGTVLRRPSACSERELRAFAALVRQAFQGSDPTLPERIQDARHLAFHYSSGARLAAIAGLKTPAHEYRDAVFRRARSSVDPAPFRLELGWVYVLPGNRGKRISERVCRCLLEQVPGSPVFATTRPDNAPMIRILQALRFERSGQPYRRQGRSEDLVLFLRP